MVFEDFQGAYHGGYLGLCNKAFLAILNPHYDPMSHIMLQLNPTDRFGGGQICEKLRNNEHTMADGRQTTYDVQQTIYML